MSDLFWPIILRRCSVYFDWRLSPWGSIEYRFVQADHPGACYRTATGGGLAGHGGDPHIGIPPIHALSYNTSCTYTSACIITYRCIMHADIYPEVGMSIEP